MSDEQLELIHLDPAGTDDKVTWAGQPIEHCNRDVLLKALRFAAVKIDVLHKRLDKFVRKDQRHRPK